jgi:TRAP-type uncharacterized transport system substrate-binding protein
VFFALSASSAVQAGTYVKENVVGLLAGEVEWLPQATGLANELAHEDRLRILPISGAGSLQALQGLEHLPNVDAAIVSSDSLAYAQQQQLLDGKIAYIARLAPLNVVLIARRELGNITALAGKRIATGPAQSAGFATGELLFGALEIPFLRVPSQGDAAIAALLNGKADAALVLASEVPKMATSDERFHVLNMPLPSQLSETYQPATLTVQAEKIETVSTSLVLAVFNWPRGSARYSTLKRFDKELFKLPNTENLAADVPGWIRHSSAKDALDQSRGDAAQPFIITPTGGEP